MREIKVRAYYKPTKTMLTSDKIESINFETKVLGVYMPIENKGFHKLRMSDFEIMQYTGLKDKNGVEIYEGDILKNKFGSIGVAKWHDKWGGFCFSIRLHINKSGKLAKCIGSEKFWDDANLYEVIGNIHQNPELLEAANG